MCSRSEMSSTQNVETPGPGQRPGLASPPGGAPCKGAGNIPCLDRSETWSKIYEPRCLRPVRAANYYLMIPRALPWAGSLRAFGAMTRLPLTIIFLTNF